MCESCSLLSNMNSYNNELSFGTVSLNSSFCTYAQVFANGLPIGWGPAISCTGPMIMENLIKQLLERYSKLTSPLSLTESSAFSVLKSVFNDTFDVLEMDSLSFVKYLGYHQFSSRAVRNDWHSIRILFETWNAHSLLHDYWIKFDDGSKLTLDDLNASPSETQLDGRFLVSSLPSKYPGFTTITEIGRVMRFTNGCVIRYHARINSISCNIDHAFLLKLSGDVESNPGPTHSKFCTEDRDRQQYKQISQLQREIAKLRKAQNKQNNYIQRQLELEKRDRNRNRQARSDDKRVAQGLFSFANNAEVIAESLATTVGPTMDMAKRALMTITEAGLELKKIFSIPDTYDVIGIFVSIVSIGNALIEKQLFNLTLHCVQLARQLNVSVNSLMTMVPNIENEKLFDAARDGIYYRGEPVDDDIPTSRVAQSLLTDMFSTVKSNPHLLPFTAFITFACGAFNLLCTGSVPSPSEMSKHFSHIGRAAQGFRAVKDLFNWLTDYIAEIYYTTVYGISAEEFKFMKNFPNLENIYAASKLIETLHKTVVDSSAEISNQILAINHELSDYLYQAGRMNSRPNVSLITNLQKRIKEHVEWASHSPARCHTIRTQPIAFYLYGHPGVGKSVLTDVLQARIFKHYLKERGVKYESCSFPRRAKNEYWEGYTNQPIVILDDFGNVKDSQVKPVEEYEELEYMVNTAQFPLKMAELKSKGVSNFTSEFIIASSNQLFPEIKHLTDPGAVFRRFHIWAEITINPKYGVAIGKDALGKPYYSFDKETVARMKGVNADDLNPLMTEHYIINLYKVSHDKQKGAAEVTRLPGKQGITFDEFWDFACAENDRRKSEGKKLADAIRKEAGISTPELPDNEKVILEKFERIFHPERFVRALAQEDVLFEEEEFSDAEEDSLFGSLNQFSKIRDRETTLRKKFEFFRNECHVKFIKYFSKIKQLGSAIASPFISVAQFFLSLFKNISTTCYEYLPSVPTTKLLTGVCATAVAVFGVWYAGLFCSQPSNINNDWCKFSRAPDNSTTPCTTCTSCKILEYPQTGDMLSHFFERTGVKSVRKDLYRLGISQEELEDVREQMRLVLKEPHPTAQALIGKCKVLQLVDQDFVASTYSQAFEVIGNLCWINCSFCEIANQITYNPLDNEDCIRCANEILSIRPSAQRVYDSQPLAPKPRNFAQRTYESQPAQPKPKQYAQSDNIRRGHRHAQGYVDCLTEMHIGARKYAQRDRVQIEQTTQVLLNNSVWIQAVDSSGRCCRSNGVFLVGRTMITTAHTILNPPHIDPIVSIIVRNPYATNNAIQIPYDQCKITQIKQMDGTPVDLALVSFPPVVPNRPKILSKFLDAKDLDLLKEGELIFSGFYEINKKTIVQEKYPSWFTVSTKKTAYYLHSNGQCPKDKTTCVCPIEIGNHIDYDLETQNGMCGALLSISNKLIHTKLVGFHVAGGAGVLALGALTTRQLLEQALSVHVEEHNIPRSYLIDGRIPYSQSLVDAQCQSKLLELGDCLSIGKAPAPAAPVVTQLRPSLIFDKIQTHIAKPAILKPTMIGEEKVDPMYKGLKKIMGDQTWVDPELLEAAASDVFQGLGMCPTGQGRVLSYEEAIKGVEGDPYMRPINRTTSPGYPYNLTNKSKGKTHWLGAESDYITDNPELRADVTALINDSRSGIRGSAISIATLKDEKRPIAKVDAGKTRVFEACPQHLVIAMRQYFLDFTAHVMRHRISNGIAVGINPYSLEWTRLAHHLQTQGNYMIAGDFSNFDGSLLMQVLVKIVEKINEWYGDSDENQLIRSALWEHICNADILVRGEVIRKTHSQPSGNPMTVIINSLFNGIVMRIAYMILKKERGMPPVCDYRNHVSEIIYGDDDVKSVSGSIIDWFNQIELTRALASFGLTYTDESKSGSILPYKPLEDVSFLKRKFVLQQDGTFMAPMDLENILEITNWIRGKATVSATKENCEQAVMELSLHTKQVYDLWSSRIREALAHKRVNFRIPTFFEQREQYYSTRDLYSREEYVPLW